MVSCHCLSGRHKRGACADSRRSHQQLFAETILKTNSEQSAAVPEEATAAEE